MCCDLKKERKNKNSQHGIIHFFTWHTFGSNLLLVCCIWGEKRRVHDIRNTHCSHWYQWRAQCLLTWLCRSCTYVLCLELRGRLGLDHKATNIWTIKLEGRVISLVDMLIDDVSKNPTTNRFLLAGWIWMVKKNYLLTFIPNHFSLTSAENVTGSRKAVDH